MAFTIKGTRFDITPKVLVVQWDRGVLSGSFAGCDLIKSAARIADGERIGPGEGPYTRTSSEHLAEPSSVCILARRMLDNMQISESASVARGNDLH